MNKPDIRNLSEAELANIFVEHLQEPKYRLKQLQEWLWKKHLASFEEMSNVSKKVIAYLQEHYQIHHPSNHVTQKSSDGTLKLAFKLADENLVEGVVIPSEKRMTACVSSQVGCSLACAFCATGFLKRMRNLTAAEIYDQVFLLNEEAIKYHNQPLKNIVYMGMGEPLLNYDEVMKSIDMISSPQGMNLSARRITLSTSGVARNIMRMADDNAKVGLALSLHAASNEKREKIMDINKSNPIEKVMEALQYFYRKTGNKVTFEYILFDNFNDTEEDIKLLGKLCAQVPAFVNIIEYNPVDGVSFNKATPQKFEWFSKQLINKGIQVRVRRSRGKDIDAACGQLANKNTLSCT